MLAMAMHADHADMQGQICKHVLFKMLMGLLGCPVKRLVLKWELKILCLHSYS